jgi:hypothetical protein
MFLEPNILQTGAIIPFFPALFSYHQVIMAFVEPEEDMCDFPSEARKRSKSKTGRVWRERHDADFELFLQAGHVPWIADQKWAFCGRANTVSGACMKLTLVTKGSDGTRKVRKY